VAYGWAFLALGQPEQTEACLVLVEKAIGRPMAALLDEAAEALSFSDSIAAVLAEVAVIRMNLAMGRLDLTEAARLAQAVLPYLELDPESFLFNQPDDLRTVVMFTSGLGQLYSGQLDAAAMSLQDAAAARSDRPDHGPMGAFDGWVPLTIATMWRLGDPAGAYEFYRRTAVVTKEGPFAQAREFYGPNKKAHDAPVRVAERDGCMKECISGAAFADVVINTFFGFSPSPDAASMLSNPQTPRPFRGTLIGVRYRGQLHDLAASDQGIQITSTSANK
jgi:hypothetical protein